MKKIIYSLGLSILLSCPAWAQEQLPAEQNNSSPAIDEEDAQTIFFSEDFLNELAEDGEEVQIFNDIPLDKTQAPQNQPNISPTRPEVEKQLTHTETSQSSSQVQTQPQDVQSVPLEQPAQQSASEVSQNALPEVQNLPNEQPLQHSATSVQITEPQPEQINAADKMIIAPESEKIISQPEQQNIDKTIVKPDVTLQQAIQNVNIAKPQEENKTAENPETPQVQHPIEQVQTLPDTPIIDKTSDLSDNPKPTLQNMVREQISEPAPSIAPSRPEPNAFSLDEGAPLPQGMLQDNGLSTNMLNRGIRISPEQRARMMMKAKFSEMDLNQDGIITNEEFIRYKTAEAQKISMQVFHQIDSNHDNILSEEEYNVLMDKMIENYIKPNQKH